MIQPANKPILVKLGLSHRQRSEVRKLLNQMVDDSCTGMVLGHDMIDIKILRQKLQEL